MEQRRKGEPEGKRLTPGERAINWAKAFAIVIPLLGVGWASNTEAVKDFIYPRIDTKPVVYDETPIEQTQCPEPITKIIERETIIQGECDISAHIKADH